jgi:hypothetical protein
MLKEEVRLYPENWDAKKLLDKIRNSVPPARDRGSGKLLKEAGVPPACGKKSSGWNIIACMLKEGFTG